MPKGRRSDYSHQRKQPELYSDTMLPRYVREGLLKANHLTSKKEPVEARAVLEDLNRLYPKREDVLIELLNVNIALNDSLAIATACEQLLRVTPNHPEAHLTLAGSYLGLMHPMLALRQFRHFLKSFPTHPRAAEVRKTIAELEPEVITQIEDLSVSEPQRTELAEKLERTQLCLSQGKNIEGRRLCEELIRVKPDLVQAYNNLSLLYLADGLFTKAIATAQQVLSLDANNVHALSNLTRLYVMTGATAEAHAMAARLHTISDDDGNNTHVPVKQVEAHSFVGDDQSVLDVLNRVENHGDALMRVLPSAHFFWHLGAVAALRLGDKKRAKALWQRALAVSPGFQLAQQNLDDLSRPVGEQQGAWPFPLLYWVRRQVIDDLATAIQVATKKQSAVSEEIALGTAIDNVLAKYPEVQTLVPILLERGDLHGRETALMIIRYSKAPALLAAAHDFALSRNGPDKLRMEAATFARAGGILPPGPIRMWSAGEWRELQLTGVEISPEPIENLHTPHVQKLYSQARDAIRANRGEQAERILGEALALEPDAPDLLNNLCKAYEVQGRTEEAYSLLHEIHRRFPDYLFARTALASLKAREGYVAEARELLAPLLSRSKFHTSEYSAFAVANFELAMAQGETNGAKSWLDMLERAYPEDANLPHLRRRLQTPSMIGRVTRRLKGF